MESSFSSKELKQILSKSYLKALTRDKLITRLRKLAKVLTKHSQNNPEAISDVTAALVQPSLMKHKNQEVQILIALCISEIIRIHAPDAPYDDRILIKIFQLFISQFPGLSKKSSHSMKYFHLIEALYMSKAYLILGDIDDDEKLRIKMFNTFFDLKKQGITTRVEYFMIEIMRGLLEEAEGLTQGLLDVILERLTAVPESDEDEDGPCQMALSLIERAEEQLDPPISHFLTETILRSNETSSAISEREELFNIFHHLAVNRREMVFRILNEYVAKFRDEDANKRKEAVDFFGRLLSSPGCVLSTQVHSIITAFAGRTNDLDAKIRTTTTKYFVKILPRIDDNRLSIKLQQILKSKCKDPDEDVRKEAISAIVGTIQDNPGCVNPKLLFAVGGRVMDKKTKVRREALIGLATIFKDHIAEKWKNGSGVDATARNFMWIPNRLMVVAATDDIMTQYFIEGILDELIIHDSFTPSERMRCLVGVFANFSADSAKIFRKLIAKKKAAREKTISALKILEEKYSEEETEISLNVLARQLPEPAQNYSAKKILRDLFTHKNSKIKQLLGKILDTSTEYRVQRASKVELLKTLNLRGVPYLFVKRLLQRISSTLFPIDGIQTLFEETSKHMREKRDMLADSGLSLLEIAAEYSSSSLDLVVPQLIAEASSCGRKFLPKLLRLASLCDLQNQEDAEETVNTLLPFVEYRTIGESIPVAKFAARCLWKTPHSGRGLRAAAKTLSANLSLSKKLPAQLRALGEIALGDPDAINSLTEDKVCQFVVEEVFPSSPKGEKKMMLAMDSKLAGIKFLQNLLLGVPEPEAVLDDRFAMVSAALVELLQEEEQHLVIEVAAAKALTKLCTKRVYYKRLRKSPSVLCSMAQVLESEDEEAVTSFGKYLVNKLGRKPMAPFDFISFFALCLHVKTFKQLFLRQLRMLIAKRRDLIKQSSMMKPVGAVQMAQNYPENSTATLVYILSKHPRVEEDQPNFKHFYKVLTHFFDIFIHGGQDQHVVMISNILARIKLHSDVEDESNENIYRIAELAHHALTTKMKGKNWTEASHPIEIPLPPWLYRKKKDGKLVQNQYIPSNFSSTPKGKTGGSRSKKRSQKKRAGGEEDGGEEDEEEAGEEEYLPSSASKGSRRKRKKQRNSIDEKENERGDQNVVPESSSSSSSSKGRTTPVRALRARHSRNTRSNTKNQSSSDDDNDEEEEVGDNEEEEEEEEADEQKTKSGRSSRRSSRRNASSAAKKSPANKKKTNARSPVSKRAVRKSPRKSLRASPGAKKRPSPDTAASKPAKKTRRGRAAVKAKKKQVESDDEEVSEIDEMEEPERPRRPRRRLRR